MFSIITNIIGYSAAVVGTMLMLPQVYKSWKTKKVEDIALGMVILYFLNCVLWLAYGLLIFAYPVIVANSIALVISVIQLFLKIKYKKT